MPISLSMLECGVIINPLIPTLDINTKFVILIMFESHQENKCFAILSSEGVYNMKAQWPSR